MDRLTLNRSSTEVEIPVQIFVEIMGQTQGKTDSAEFQDEYHQPVGIYGWRKRCLYGLILFLMIVVIMNLALTVWILRVLDFSIHGMGKLRVTEEGIRVEGGAEFLKSIYTARIRARKNSRLDIESDKNININARDGLKNVTNSFIIGDRKILSYSESFQVMDKEGNMRLLVNEDEMLLGVDEMTCSNKAIFNGSIETPAVRGPISKSLSIESQTSSIHISGHDSVVIKSPAGDTQIHSSDSIRFRSEDNKIILNSTNIYLKNVLEATPNTARRSRRSSVYQLCVCKSGQLYRADPGVSCSEAKDVCG
ncbi:hypothetical protein ScPMuIL_010611 [Solemya velum]